MPGDGAVMKHSLKRVPICLSLRRILDDWSDVHIPDIGQRCRRVRHARGVRKTQCRLSDVAREFDLIRDVRTPQLTTKTAETPGNIGLKSDARLFAVIAHVNTGCNLFADHMGGCDLYLTSERGGIDCLAGSG